FVNETQLCTDTVSNGVTLYNPNPVTFSPLAAATSDTVKGGSSIASVVAGSKPTRSWDKPQFDDIAPRNITAIVGQTAELNCYVKHPGDRVTEEPERTVEEANRDREGSYL
ncbi:hypothetical protein ALC56_09373, partial [Trachymyrmex septentrionalis]